MMIMDNWLRNIRDTYCRNERRITGLATEADRLNMMCELNVIDQAGNVARTTVVQNAWKRGQKLDVHGWIYAFTMGF